jgi:hypothetical protein
MERNIFVRSCTNANVLLSPNVLYPAPLSILAISVTSYLGGMAIAEDILAVPHAMFIFKINFASPSGGLRGAGERLGTTGANFFSRLRHHLRHTEPRDDDERSLTV